MTTSSGLLFLSSFIVTYNFTAMQEAMTRTGLTLGFYGGIAIIGWFYQYVTTLLLPLFHSQLMSPLLTKTSLLGTYN